MLQALCRCYVHSDETDEEVKTLVGTAVRLMAGVLRPLGSVLTSLPLGPDHPGQLAGPAFYMVDPSQFVLPYWEAAWKVVVQRLGEMADACARLGLEAGLGQIAKLEPNVWAASASQASSVAGSSPSEPAASGTCLPWSSTALPVRTAVSTDRRLPPMCRTSRASVQSGQVGTVSDRSAPWRMSLSRPVWVMTSSQ